MKASVQIGRWTFAWAIFLAVPAGAFAHGDVHAQILALTAKFDGMGARGQCSKSTRQASQMAVLLHKRGELHRAHADSAAALDDYHHALVCDAKLVVVHLSRGRVLLESGAPEAALGALNLFLSAQPLHEEGVYLLARAWQRVGDREEAEAVYARLQQLLRDPTPDFFLERAANLAQAEQVDRALAVLEAGIERLGSIAALMDAALLLEESDNRHGAALQRVDAWMKSNPHNLHLRARKVALLGRMGRLAEADVLRRQALQAILALPPPKQATSAMKRLKAKLQGMALDPTAKHSVFAASGESVQISP